MSQQCQACRADTRDQRLCGRCQAIARVDLGNIPDLADEVLTVMVKQTNYQAKSDGGRPTDPALTWARIGDQFLTDLEKYIDANPIATPYAKAAAACAHDLRATLVSWTRLLAEEAGVPYPVDTVPALAKHLARHLSVIANHEAAGEFHAEITKLTKRIMVVIDSPKFRSKIPVGPCIAQLADNLECSGTVVAYTYADEELVGTLACKACKTEWEPRRWLEVGPQILRKKDTAA